MTTLTLRDDGLGTRPVDVIRSEWAKLRSLRSTWWVLIAVVASAIGIGCLVSAATAARWGQLTAAQRAGFDPTFRSLTGLFFGQLAVGVLGVVAITSEYATGLIRSTLAAVPRRRVVLAAKAVAVTVPVLVVGAVACTAAFLAGQAILGTKGAGVSLGAPGELRVVVFGGALYLTLLALLAFGLGAILRTTAGGISAFVGLVLVLPVLISPLPSPWGRDIAEYLPSEAGQAMLNVHASANSLPPWIGFAVLAGWAAAAVAASLWLVTRRDA
jgi:ABC-2 type transport system permease protein